jgi:hypothetical protein
MMMIVVDAAVYQNKPTTSLMLKPPHQFLPLLPPDVFAVETTRETQLMENRWRHSCSW